MNAINSKGVIVAIGTTDPIPEDYTDDSYIDLCNIASINFSGESTDEIDSTTLCDEARTFIPGFTDYGTVTLDGNFLPGFAAQMRAKALKDDAEIGNFRVTYPDDGMGNGAFIQYFKASVQNLTPGIAVGDKVTLSMTLRISGKVEDIHTTTP